VAFHSSPVHSRENHLDDPRLGTPWHMNLTCSLPESAGSLGKVASDAEAMGVEFVSENVSWMANWSESLLTVGGLGSA
jgi:hypothetical protein